VTAGDPKDGATDRDLLGWLVDLHQLRQMPQRYARAVDARDHEALAELFHPDGRVSGMQGEASVPDYLARMRSAPPAFRSGMHVLGEPLVELRPGADRARTDTYAVVYQREGVAEPHDDLVLGMRYVDELVRHEGGWRIIGRTTQVLWTRTIPATEG
jgi:hypothetical protein